MIGDRDIKTICDEILYRVGELAGLAIKAEVEATNRKFEEQIEKMKCCGNCKHKVECDTQLLDAFMSASKFKIACKNKDKWELKA